MGVKHSRKLLIWVFHASEHGTESLFFFFLLRSFKRTHWSVVFFFFYFKEFEASYKARNALKMCFQPHKTLKNGCNTHRWIELMFQVLVRHSAQLLALIEVPDCPKHCFETRCGQELVKGMCPAFRDERMQAAHQPECTGVGLGAATEQGGGRGWGQGRNICDLWGCIDWSLSAEPSVEDCTVPKPAILWGCRCTLMGQIGPFDQVRKKIWETGILNLSIALCLKRAFSILLTRVLFQNATGVVHHLAQ